VASGGGDGYGPSLCSRARFRVHSPPSSTLASGSRALPHCVYAWVYVCVLVCWQKCMCAGCLHFWAFQWRTTQPVQAPLYCSSPRDPTAHHPFLPPPAPANAAGDVQERAGLCCPRCCSRSHAASPHTRPGAPGTAIGARRGTPPGPPACRSRAHRSLILTPPLTPNPRHCLRLGTGAAFPEAEGLCCGPSPPWCPWWRQGLHAPSLAGGVPGACA